MDAEKPVRVFRKSLPSQPGRITGIMNVLFPLQLLVAVKPFRKKRFHPAQNRCDWRSQVVEIPEP